MSGSRRLRFRVAKTAALHEHQALSGNLSTALPASPPGLRKNRPAGTLRGLCALALVNCRSVPSRDVLAHLTPIFADKQLTVQVNAARAVEQIGSDSGVLRLDRASAIPWAGRFLHTLAPGEASAEAAWLLLKKHSILPRDPDLRSTLLITMALTRRKPLPIFYSRLSPKVAAPPAKPSSQPHPLPPLSSAYAPPFLAPRCLTASRKVVRYFRVEEITSPLVR